MPRRPKNDLHTLARAARQQIVRAEQLGESLDKRREHLTKEGEIIGIAWSPDEEWRKDFNSVNATIAQAGQALMRALEGNKKDLGGVPMEQLESQFKAEMIRAAGSMTPEEWAAMDKIRMQSALAQALGKPEDKKKKK